MKLRAAVIIDGLALCRWQIEALQLCSQYLEVVAYLNCRNSASGRKRLRHLLYYGLNLTSMRPVPRRRLPVVVGDAEVLSFECDRAGGWERIPPEVTARARAENYDVVLKFGMGLLRDPQELGARHGVLSFHHGDPSVYRGRPAGFYELLDGAPYIGVGVQRINNTLDGGEFLAIRRSKAHHHSYKRTLENAYSTSGQLLKSVIMQISAGTSRRLKVTPGRLVKLPSNGVVVRFLLRLTGLKVKRLFRGLFFEKNWAVSLGASVQLFAALDSGAKDLILVPERTLSTPKEYVFLADPFFSPDGQSIFVEALSRRTGLGEILRLNAETGEVIGRCAAGKHYSYPATYGSPSESWMLAETASWAAPHILQFADGDGKFAERINVLGLEGRRLLDPTYFYKDDTHYIFAGERGTAEDTLSLFVSKSRLGPYSVHPASPIVTAPSGARMGGHLLARNGRLLRIGQDNSFGYGEGSRIFEIVKISPECYEEHEVLRVRAGEPFLGPHTINVFRESMVYDIHTDRFSIMAGYRRLLSLLAKN